MKIACVLCGTVVNRASTRICARPTCSRSCAATLRRGVKKTEEAKAAARANRVKPPRQRKTVTLVCAGCGVCFERAPVYAARNKGGFHYCSKECATAHRRGPLAINWKGDAAKEKSGRVRAITRYPVQPCEQCGASPNETRIERHHIDKNLLNNERANIRFLCVPCHKRVHAEMRRAERLATEVA